MVCVLCGVCVCGGGGGGGSKGCNLSIPPACLRTSPTSAISFSLCSPRVSHYLQQPHPQPSLHPNSLLSIAHPPLLELACGRPAGGVMTSCREPGSHRVLTGMPRSVSAHAYVTPPSEHTGTHTRRACLPAARGRTLTPARTITEKDAIKERI